MGFFVQFNKDLPEGGLCVLEILWSRWCLMTGCYSYNARSLAQNPGYFRAVSRVWSKVCRESRGVTYDAGGKKPQ